MIIIIGKSGSGKSTVAKCLEKKGMHEIVSYTTRPPRKGERDGVNYHFVTEERFLSMKARGFFAETGCYRGWHYGSAKEDYNDPLAVAVLTPHGLRQIQRVKKDVFSVYLKCDRRLCLIRLLKRGDDIEECYRRSLSDLGQFDGVEDEVTKVLDDPNMTPEETADLLMEAVREQ